MKRNSGITLIETILVIAILVVMLAILLPAISKIRQAYLLSQSKNNLRQQILALHVLGDRDPDGYMPGWNDPFRFQVIWPDNGPALIGATKANHLRRSDLPVFGSLREFFEPYPISNAPVASREYLIGCRKRLPVFTSPADPTMHESFQDPTQTYDFLSPVNYAANMMAFLGPPKLATSYPDGTSQTIAIAEHCFAAVRTPADGPGEFSEYINYFDVTPCNQPVHMSGRRATFADPGCNDVVPKQIGSTTTGSSIFGKTFQVGATVNKVDMKIPSTGFRDGLPVAFVDGSVRVLYPTMSKTVFWSLVTPNGGEAAVPE